VQQAQAALEVQKGALRQAQLAQVPVLNLTTNYQRFAYPANSAVIPHTLADFYPAWTVALGFTVPVWTSGRLLGDKLVARANVADAEARVHQGQRAASLDVQLALKSLEQAEANWVASIGTEDQADKATRIAEVRYTNGISTQLELSDIRNLLIQSQANRLSAAKALQLARLRITLLRDLPLGSGGGSAAASTAGTAGSASGAQTTSTSATTSQASTTTSSTGTTGRPE
jgi:outer membrane protein TolC